MIIIMENQEISDNVWYHADLNDNAKPDIDNRPEIGLHCGTLEHALKRYKKSYLYEVRLHSNINIITLNDDAGDWYSPVTLRILYDLNFIDDCERMQMRDQLAKYCDTIAKSTFLRNWFINKGFDVFSYPNGVEASGESICVMKESAIKSFKKVGRCLNGNVIWD